MKERFLREIEGLRFKTGQEWYLRKNEIREGYLKLDIGDKEMYKWYFFYETCMLPENLKSLMWEYMNKDVLDGRIRIDLFTEYKRWSDKVQRLKEWNRKKES